MSLLSIRRRHSLVRSALRQWEVRVAICLLAAASFAAGYFGQASIAIAAVAAAVILLALQWRRVASRAVGATLRASVDSQREALVQQAPAVVVGSSFGGAVAALLLAEGHWTGPTLLLAPALKQLTQHVLDRTHGALPYAAALQALSAFGASCPTPRVLIVHAAGDSVVPFADSKDLAGLSGLVAELQREEGDDHGLRRFSKPAVIDEWIWRTFALGGDQAD